MLARRGLLMFIAPAIIPSVGLMKLSRHSSQLLRPKALIIHCKLQFDGRDVPISDWPLHGIDYDNLPNGWSLVRVN